MSRYLSCLVNHDFRIVGLAFVICVVGSCISLSLFRMATKDGANRYSWLFLAGGASGSTVWATHFLGMLAYGPGSSMGFDSMETILSWIVAVVTCSAGLLIALLRRMPCAPEFGGIFVGLGIGAMHFLGMSALQISGVPTWDGPMVVLSLLVGTFAGSLSLSLVSRSRHPFTVWYAAGAFVVAVCGLHFIAMSAVAFVADPTLSAPSHLINSNTIALGFMAVTLIIIGAGFATRLIVLNEGVIANRRVLALADAAIEGILVLQDGTVVAANRSFEQMSGYGLAALSDLSLLTGIISEISQENVFGTRIQTVLNTANGSLIPVEVVSSRGQDGQVIYAVRDLSDTQASHERIQYLAHHDTLTDLPNREAFIEHLEKALAEAGPEGTIAVIGMDLDRYRQVKELFGHAAGDQVLMQVAEAMRIRLRKGCYLARIRGDEFVALQIGLPQPASADDFCKRMIAAVSEPVQIASGTVDIGISIGVACYPADGQTSAELIANADLAMYRAKEKAESAGCFFVPEMYENIRLRRSLSHDLRDAIARDELQLYYQVQTSILTSEIVGYEVLLRWNHPKLGQVSPADFIPIAEENGLITSIGTWVLERACLDAVKWPQPYRIAVNVSGVQFMTGDLAGTVHSILLQTGLAASRLELEITETVLVANTERTTMILRKLKAIGVSIAMDDFGTGYSSLSTLQAFPFDKIKIDRSFMEGLSTQPQARSIIRAIVALGHSLEIPVLAEGIETPSHLAFLRDEGCDEAQGYFLGRPMPQEQIAALAPSKTRRFAHA